MEQPQRVFRYSPSTKLSLIGLIEWKIIKEIYGEI